MDTGFAITRGFQENLPQFLANGMRKRRLFGAVHKLVNEHDVARLAFFLQGADGADADDPGDAEFFHRPDVGAMVEFRRQNPVAASVARQKDDIASGQFAGEQIIRWRTEGRPDLHPFLSCKAFDVIKTGAADDADAIIRHGGFIALAHPKVANVFPVWRS